MGEADEIKALEDELRAWRGNTARDAAARGRAGEVGAAPRRGRWCSKPRVPEAARAGNLDVRAAEERLAVALDERSEAFERGTERDARP